MTPASTVSVMVAAEATGVTGWTVYGWIHSGILTATRAGKRGHWRISRESLMHLGVTEQDITESLNKEKETK